MWSWDITKLKGPAKWTCFHLYVILDIYSRYVVGWLLAHRESAELAEQLIADTLEKEEHRSRDPHAATAIDAERNYESCSFSCSHTLIRD